MFRLASITLALAALAVIVSAGLSLLLDRHEIYLREVRGEIDAAELGVLLEQAAAERGRLWLVAWRYGVLAVLCEIAAALNARR